MALYERIQPETAIDWSHDARYQALLEGRNADPFAFLGMHDEAEGPVVRCFVPWAHSIAVVDAGTGEVTGELPRVHEAGLFAGHAGKPHRFAYRLRIGTDHGTVEMADAYSFGPVLSEFDVYLLAEGNHFRSYEKLGAHPLVQNGIDGVGFAVWAPSARSVSLVGAFGDWDGRRYPMRHHPSCGIWDIFIPHLKPGQPYKFEIHGVHGGLLPLKADPYASQMEMRPANASIVASPPEHHWQDSAWMTERAKINDRAAPISIYEVHLASWRRHDGNGYLSYRDLADQLVPYVAWMGFTHIEVLPVSEYPFDGSWGYQPIGLFAPTSRFGTPDDFRYFVDACHQAGIALWIDWVPGHFPSDAHGLAEFDGTHLYEHADPRQGFHKDWNTLIFNYGRREVRNYLISNALSWLDRFHVDGLRVDAVASMLYLDYSRKAGEWIPNAFGGRENLEAIDFLRRMNELVYAEAPGAATAAEESTAWPMVSQPTHVGGLGFGFKWNMGWMNDTLRYIGNDPIHRKYHHHDLTFGLLYAFTENFILPLSHDEVVHGKGSIIARMPGDDWQRHANLRAYYAFMWAHPGKKLMFMGCEFGQEKEWNFDASLDWHTLDNPMKKGVQHLVRDLNHLYRAEPALHRLDCVPRGFAWIDASDSEQSIISFLRYEENHQGTVLAVCNFTPMPRQGYRIGVPHAGYWAEKINTDADLYGGSGMGNAGGVAAEPVAWHGHEQSLSLTIPPLSIVIFVHQRG